VRGPGRGCRRETFPPRVRQGPADSLSGYAGQLVNSQAQWFWSQLDTIAAGARSHRTKAETTTPPPTLLGVAVLGYVDHLVEVVEAVAAPR